MYPKQIDELIIKQINDGSERAFAALYQAYYTYLNALCFYWLNNGMEAREVVNDVFLQVWNRRQNLTYPIHTYLVRAAQNGSIDRIRTRQSRLRTLEGHKKQFTQFYRESYILSTPEPLQYVELRRTEEEICKVLDGLPPRCREIFEAWFREGKSPADIAGEMDINVNTVRVQLKKAIERLRETLEHLLSIFLV